MLLLTHCSDGLMMMMMMMMMMHVRCLAFLQKFLEIFWNNNCASISNYCTEHTIFQKDKFVFCRLSALNPCLLHIWEFTVVVYNRKIMFIVDCKDLGSDRFSWPPWYFVWHYFVLVWCGLIIKVCWSSFDHFIFISIHVYWLTC